MPSDFHRIIRRQYAHLKQISGWSLWFDQPMDKAERQAIWVLLTVCLCLTMLEYLCDRQWVGQVLAQHYNSGWAHAFDACCVQPANPLGRNVYWVLVNLACYLLLPLAVIRFVLRRPLADFGVRAQGALQAYPVYLLMLAVMLPLVWYASATGGFLARYPFLRLPAGSALWPVFLWWELLYCAQFFALEFFFRGFMLHGLAPRFGKMSVVVMTLPYCALHFGKPLPETLAAIIAGLVLGTLSLKSRSILLGALIHCSVALSMDGAALWRKGLFAAGGHL